VPLLSAPTRIWLRLLTAGVLLLIAANFVAQWWYWERRAPELGVLVDQNHLIVGRLSLVWAAATVVAAIGVFDLIGTLPRPSRRAVICLAIACVSIAACYVTEHLLIS